MSREPVRALRRHARRVAAPAALAALALAASVALARPASAQTSAGGAAAGAARLERLAPAAREAVVRIADSARASGLPVEPLYSKAEEGAFKRATDAQIVAAVRALARALADARTALGAESTADELVAGASALRAGVSTDALRRLGATRGSGSGSGGGGGGG